MKILIALMFLTGCTVDGFEVNGIYKACSDKGGVDYYDTWHNSVRCNNGNLIDYQQWRNK